MCVCERERGGAIYGREESGIQMRYGRECERGCGRVEIHTLPSL